MDSSRPRPAMPWWAWLLAGAYAAITLALAARTFTIDGLYYLGDMRTVDWGLLLHPHHVLMEPFYLAWTRIWPGSDIAALQTLATLLTCAGLVVIAPAVARLLPRPPLAVLTLAWLAASNLVWLQATQPDAGPWFWFFSAVNAAWAVRLCAREPGPRTALALATTTALGVLFHQSLALAAPVLAAILGANARPGRRLRLAIGMLGLTAAIVLAVYVAAAAMVTGSLAPRALWQWATGYREEFAGRCGQLGLMVSAAVPRGLGTALLSGEPLKAYVYGHRAPDLGLVLALAPFAIVAALLAAGLAGAAVHGRRAPSPERRELLALGALGVVAAVFAAWWDPSQRKFWAPVLPGLIVIAVWGWDRLLARRRAGRLATGGLAVVVALTVVWNLAAGVLPKHRTDDARQPLLTFLRQEVGPGDTVILQEDRIWQCATYFVPTAPVFGIPGPRSDRLDAEQTVWHAAVAAATASFEHGGRVWVAGSQLDRLREALGDLSAREVLSFRDSDLGPDVAAQTCYEVTRR